MNRYMLFIALAISILTVKSPAGMPDTAACGRSRVLEAAREVSPAEYPDADTVMIANREHIRYNPDGTSVKVNEAYYKILTEKGRRECSALEFHYSRHYASIKIDKAEIIRPDGTVIPIDIDAGSRDAAESGQMSSNIYDPGNRVLTLKVAGLEIGDILHYTRTRQVFKARIPDMWCDYFVLQYTSPILQYDITVDAPESMPLRKIVIKEELEGSVTSSESREGDRIIYRWEARNVPRIFEEPAMPAYYTVVQRLLVSTEAEWQAISRWYWNLCLPRLEKTTPAMKEKVRELTDGLTTPEQRIKAIFSFVAGKIRYMGITPETEAPGYEPHDVNITFENRYGVCRDKAALLVAMLRLDGFKAYPVIFHVGPRKDEEVPNNFFNHAIASVETAPGQYLLMDPTDENTRDIFPAYLCNQSYLVATPEGETLRTSRAAPAENNLVRISTSGGVDSGGTLSATTEIQFEGVNDGVYRGAFMNWNQERRFNFFSGRLKNAIPGAKLKAVEIYPRELADVRVPLRAVLSYSAENFPVANSGYVMFRPPWFGTDFGLVNFVIGDTGLEKRRYPMQLYSTCGVEEKFSISIADIGEAVSLPEVEKIDNDDISWQQTFAADAETVGGEGKFMIKTMEFSPEAYLRLKESLRKIEYDRRKMPLLRRGGDKKADSVILSHDTEIRLDETGDAVTTIRVRRQILTYAGIKKNSELKFNFIPPYSEVRIIRATVSGTDGITREIGPDEINIMDAPWVGRAPRYPAEKIMVLSLPGVSRDSIIEYCVEITCRKQPFFSAIAQFRLQEPIHGKNVALSLPQTMAGKLKYSSDHRIAFERRSENGTVSLAWATGKQERIADERHTPPLWTFSPAVFISNGNWRDYAAVWRQALKAAAAESETCRKLARKLIEGHEAKHDRLRIIRDYHAEKIIVSGPVFNALPPALISPADRTLGDGYGHSADRAAVLYAMLAEAGFEPEFVFGVEYPDVPELLEHTLAFPQQDIFDNVMVRVKIDGTPLYLNTSDQYAATGAFAQNRQPVLELDSGAFAPAVTAGDLDNRRRIDIDIRLDENGDAVIERRRILYGTHQAAFNKSYSEMTPEERRRFLQNETVEIAQAATMITSNINASAYPAVSDIKVKVTGYAVRDNQYLYFRLPLPRFTFIDNENRENPYLAATETLIELNMNIHLPETHGEYVLLPDGFEWVSPANDSTVSYSIRQNGTSQLNATIKINLKPGFYSQEKFAELVKLNDQLSRPAATLVLLKMK